MKSRSWSLFLLFFIAYGIFQEISNGASQNTQQALFKQQQSLVATMAFPAQLPTKSIHEKLIDQIYGPSGLNIATSTLIMIKQAYCYLEFLVKIDKVKKDTQHHIGAVDFKNFLQPRKDNMPLMPTQALVASSGWTAVQITTEDLLASDVWQHFIQAMICDSLDNDAQSLVDIARTNTQMFCYIPNIETAYATNDFTNLRLYQESLQLQMLMQGEQRQRYLAQSNAWKSLNPTQLHDAVAKFKITDFYNYTHNLQSGQSSQAIPSGSKATSMIIASPTREQILCYFMFVHIQSAVQDLLTSTNFQKFISSMSSAQLTPNFSMLTPADITIFSDFFILKNITEQNKINPHITDVSMQLSQSITASTSAQTAGKVTIQALANTDAKVNLPEYSPAELATVIFGRLPIVSSYENLLEQLYGEKGLQIIPEQLKNLQKTYCYLEFLVKVDKIKNNSQFAQYQAMFKNFLYPADPTKFLLPTEELVNNSIWKSILVTQQDIQNSPAWQNFVKVMICDCFDREAESIINMSDVNNELFSYLPNIETAYDTDDFTQLRLYAESVQLYATMQADQKNRYIQQCADWKNFDVKKLTDAIATFKKTDFYTLTHIQENASPSTSLQPKTPVVCPLLEDMVSYFMLVTMQTDIFDMMTLQNLPQFLDKAGSSTLAPNLYTYTSADFVYLSDYLSLNQLIQSNKAVPKQSTISMQSATTILSQAQDTVAIQKKGIGRSFKKMGKSVNKGFNKTIVKPVQAKVVQPVQAAIIKPVQAAVVQPAQAAIVNQVLKPIDKGFTDDFVKPTQEKFAKPTDVFFKKAVAPALTNAFKQMDTGIGIFANGLTTGLVETCSGIVWLSCSYASLFDPSIHPDQQARKVRAKINEHRGLITSILMTTLVVVTTILTAGLTLNLIPILIGSMATDHRAMEAVMNSPLVKGMTLTMTGIMTGMEILTDACTTGLIELSVGLTYGGAWIGKACGAKINPQLEANKTRANMEAHRSMINIIMSVVLTAVITAVIIVCTGGAAAPEALALDAAAVSAESAATAAEITAAEYSILTIGIADEAAAPMVIQANTAAETAIALRNTATAAREAANVAAASAAISSAGTSSASASATEGTAAGTETSAATGVIAEEAVSSADSVAIIAAEAEVTAVGGSSAAAEVVSEQAVTMYDQAATFITKYTAGLDWGFAIGQLLNAGFGVFGAMAAVAQDQAAAEAADQERKSIQTLWKFVEDSKVSLTQTQSLFLDELHKKHQVAVENQAFGLEYYKNFLNSSADNVQDQIAQVLAGQQVQLLTPNSNGLTASDIGSSWGLQTPFDYLYPAQGFMSATLGRPDFPYAQEVAQAPLASETHGSNSSAIFADSQPAATKLWFNQRAVSVLKQAVTAPLNVEIKFRVIYNLATAYHVGLYLGGNYHDYRSTEYIQSIQDEGSIDLDEARLAKMFVVKRDDKDATPSLGLYENEGKGWIIQQPVDAKTLNNASIYHMSANLQKDQLTVAFWSESNPAGKWTQTVTVTPCDQRTFGVIFSGAAIEWGVVTPNQPITQNKQARLVSNSQSEIDRERASKAQWKTLLNPTFGTMKMQSLGKPALLQGQYIYTTQNTGLVDGQGNPVSDYMVFATYASNVVKNIGNSPTPADATLTPNAILSVITGNVYNSSGKVVAHKQNAWQVYTKKSKSIPADITPLIEQAAQVYEQQLLHVDFGSHQLTAVSAAALHAGLFIYTCPTTITMTDKAGKSMNDYLVMADLINGSLGAAIGMPPSVDIQGMVSLITGNVYSKTSTTPVDSGYLELPQYTKNYGALPQDIATAISVASAQYKALAHPQAKVAQATKISQATVVPSVTISLDDLMNAAPPVTGGFQLGLSDAAPSKLIATAASISQLQIAAAGSAGLQF